MYAPLTYCVIKDLRQSSAIFSKLIEEYGSSEHEGKSGDAQHEPQVETAAIGTKVQAINDKSSQPKAAALMQAEERETGGITWQTYSIYLRFGGR